MASDSAEPIERWTAKRRVVPKLRWWLLGFGDKTEVLAPKYLRDEFAAITRRAAAQYREP